MVKDEWVRAAMTDDKVVVELLVRLKQAQAASPATSKPQAVIPLSWGLRLPRSKPSSSSPFVFRRKDGDSSTRCSPTTPLSWSGGCGGAGSASPSAIGDGFEDTSRRSSPPPRSKVTAETGTTSSTKRSRRKKTFAELRIEEGLLIKEKTHLKMELANLNATFNEQRSRNENLKRIKLDLNLQYAKISSFATDEIEEAVCSQSHSREPSSSTHVISTLSMDAKGDDDTPSGSCRGKNTVPDHDGSFLLPDLNLMPSEEDTAAEVLSGVR